MKSSRSFGMPLLILGAMVVALAGACSSGDDDSEPTSASQTDATRTHEPTVAGGQTVTPSATGKGATGRAASRFGELVKGAENAKYAVSYDLKANTTDDQFAGSFKLYQSPDRTRVDFDLEQSGETIVGALIDTPENSFVCLDANGEQTCIKLARGATAGSPFPNPSDEITETVDELTADADKYTVTEARGQTIGGAPAECFEIDGPEGKGTACFSKEGVPLLLDLGGPSGTYSLQATEYRPSVTDADFEPPYPVTELGN